MKVFRNFFFEDETDESRWYPRELAFGKLDESGAGIKRVLSALESGKDFAIITAYRQDTKWRENRQNNRELLQIVREHFGKQTGAYKLVGHWKECSEPLGPGETISDCKGKIINGLEESWLIIKPDHVSSEDFENLIRELAVKYKQDAYVIRRNGKLEAKGKDGSVWENLGKADRNSISKGFDRVINKQGYSELAKDRRHGRVNHIVFENQRREFKLSIVIPDDTLSSKSVFAYGGILY